MKRGEAIVLGIAGLGGLVAAWAASRSSGPPTPLPPPQTPTGLSAVATPNRVTLTWNASQWADTYAIYRDGSLAFTTAALTVADATVEPSSTYQYAILAQNASGPSELSAALTVNTPAAPPGVPLTPVGLAAVVA
jgi:hypothetical protein